MINFSYTIRARRITTAPEQDVLLVPGVIVTYNNGLVVLSGTKGWPARVSSGDPFIDGEGKIGFQTSSGSGVGTYSLEQRRTLKSVTTASVTFSMGQFQAWSSRNVAIYMTTTGVDNNTFKFVRPKWQLQALNGASFETNFCTDWPWESQWNPGAQGQDLRPAWLRVVQDRYLPGKTYPFNAIAVPNLAMVVRPEADAMSPAQDGVDPNGRKWLGWSIDANGVRRRIRDISPAEAEQIGHDNGFVPPRDSISEATGQSYEWATIRVLGPAGDNAVAASGVLQYTESYRRLPTANERRFYTGSATATQQRQMVPFNDSPAWSYTLGDVVVISETRTTFMFCEMIISADHITITAITGRSTSSATNVQFASDGNERLKGQVFKRKSGQLIVYWDAPPLGYSNSPAFDYYRVDPNDQANSAYVTPNGWIVPTMWPSYRVGGLITRLVVDENYMPIPVFADDPTFAARPPEKPADWDDATMGPWVEPPLDIPPGMYWKGITYWDVNQQRFSWQQGPGFEGYFVGIQDVSQWGDENGYGDDYAKTGARQTYGRGSWTISQLYGTSGPFRASREAGRIVPGTSNGQQNVPQYAEDDGGNVLTRWFPWPKQGAVFAKTQFGPWLYGVGGSYQVSPIDLGEANGIGWLDTKLGVPKGE